MRWFMHHASLGREGHGLGVSSAEQVEETLIACETSPSPDEIVEALKTVERL
jgi:hypothetical protein